MRSLPLTPADSGLREACGVVATVGFGGDAARFALVGAAGLQHRGQESAGLSWLDDDEKIHCHTGMGLVRDVFKEFDLSSVSAEMSIAHNRYSTSGDSSARHAQPFVFKGPAGKVAVAHNGNLTRRAALDEALAQHGQRCETDSDSEAIARFLAATRPPDDEGWQGWLAALHPLVDGAYSLVILTERAVYAVRDPRGMRPLCIGVGIGDDVERRRAVVSESGVLTSMGLQRHRDVQPGESVRVTTAGIDSATQHAAPQGALCAFEYVYFSRADTYLENQGVHAVRERFGIALANQAPADVDVVIPVPDSARSAAIGFANAAGLRYGEGLLKNRYEGRTFIAPDNTARQNAVRRKYTAVEHVVRDRHVVLVDDSIVRGNTLPPIVKMLRNAGALSVHLRIAAPPICHPCFMGVDMGTYEELIAARMPVNDIAEALGADSLAYLDLARFLDAMRPSGTRINHQCDACFSGRYPVEVDSD